MSSRNIEKIRELSSLVEPIEPGVSPALHRLHDVRSVLFDVYGTLFISGCGDVGVSKEMTNKKAVYDALHAAGVYVLPDFSGAGAMRVFYDEIRAIHLRSKQNGAVSPEIDVRNVWETVLKRFVHDKWVRADVVSEELVEAVAIEFECRTNPVWPMPGLAQCLKAVNRAACSMGIVSNAQFYTPLLFKAFLNREVDQIGFQPDLCAWSYKVGESKPSKTMFEGVLEMLGMKNIMPDQVVYVGNDMLNDIWTASQMGCQTVLFAGDKRSLRLREDDERCAGLKPDAVITHLDQLQSIIN